MEGPPSLDVSRSETIDSGLFAQAIGKRTLVSCDGAIIPLPRFARIRNAGSADERKAHHALDNEHMRSMTVMKLTTVIAI